VLVLLASATAAAEGPYVTTTCSPGPCPTVLEPARRPASIVADLGLSVIHVGYQHPIGRHLAVSLTAGIFGTYFLPWFDLGDDVKGLGAGLRGTWFAHEDGRGFYVAPYVRVHGVRGEHDDLEGSGPGVTAGAFAGWAFGLGEKLDLQLGLGAQYIYQSIDTDAGKQTSSTPFIAIDIVLGYRL